MTKGKPWPIEDERKLRDHVKTGVSFEALVASFGNRYTRNAVYQKMIDLGLKEEEEAIIHGTSSSIKAKLILPKELPSVEEKLKSLSAALAALETPGLDRDEMMRLRIIILGVKVYKELFVDYVKYCELEAEVSELRRKLESDKEIS
jgi:hypothetical protein